MASKNPPRAIPAEPSPSLRVAATVVKLVAMAIGFVGTLIGLMAIVGIWVESGWVRALGALLVGIGVPLFVADRLLPKDSSRPAAGIVTDVLALAWFGFTFAFCGLLGGATRPALVREGDRLMASGWVTTAQAAYFFAGVSAKETTDGAAPPAGSGSASAASASASAGPSPSTSASAEMDAGVQARDGGTRPAADATKDRTPAELFQALAPSVVTIFVKGRAGEGSGTGFLIDAEGTIATNHHVVDGATAVQIKFMSAAKFESVELLVDSAAVDLALVRVDLHSPVDGGPPVDVPALTLGDSEAVVVGERAISIGNPLGLEHTLTDGLISSRRIYEGRPWIQMSVPVSPGNSGGPLFNMRGEVVGITTQQVLGGGGGRAQNLNLAVPVNELKKLIQPTYPQRRKFGDGAGPSQW